MNKPVYVGMSVLDISKTLMYKFWWDFIKPKYLDRTKLCYTYWYLYYSYYNWRFFWRHCWWCYKMVWYIYDENDKRPLPMGIKKKVYGFFKDQLGGKIMKDSN